MMDIISKISISEVILLFNLIFVLPTLVLLLLRLRKYEALHGSLPNEPRERRFSLKKKPKEDKPQPAEDKKQADENAEVYPYRTKVFLSPAERTCLKVMREVLGKEVDIFPKVALWETVDPMDSTPANINRLHGKNYDFLVCDQKTGQPLTAVMFKGGRGRASGNVQELTKICEAAGASVIFIEMADDYNARKMKEALRIPELDLD